MGKPLIVFSTLRITLMKLHLPKMLLTAVLAAVTASVTWAEETYDLLESPSGWSFNDYAYDYVNGDIYKSVVAWGHVRTAEYRGRYIYTVGDDNTLDFSFTYNTATEPHADSASATNYVLYFILSGTGTDDDIVVGGTRYADTTMGYGTTKPANNADKILTDFKDSDGNPLLRAWGKDYKVDGTVKYANETYTLTLTTTFDGKKYTSESIDLGSSFDFSNFGMYGFAGKDTLSALTVTGNVTDTRYHAVITGDTAVTDVQWTRNGTSYTTSDISLTDGTSGLAFTGSGTAAAVLFAESPQLAFTDVVGGSVTLKGNDTFNANNKLTITTDGLLAANNSTVTIGEFVTLRAGTAQVEGGSTLALAGGDALGYGTTATGSIILQGDSADSVATLRMLGTDVNDDGRQTLTTAIIMRGNALITGGSLESFGTVTGGDSATNILTATGTNNIIESVIYVRSNFEVNVAGIDDDLKISGNIGWRDAGKGTFTKSGSGKLTLSGSSIVFENDFSAAGGRTIITKNSEFKGALRMQKGATFDYTGGTHSVAKLDIHNLGSTSTETLSISGATVTVTGDDQTTFDSGKNFNTTSGAAVVVLGHWHNGTGKISVGGDTASVFNVLNGTIRMSYDSSSILDITQNGTVNTKHIQFSNQADDDAVINLSGGRLNLGEGGITANPERNQNGRKRELNLNSGTLGVLANSVTIAAGTSTVSGAVSFDTDIVNETGVKTGAAANMSFSQLVTVASDGALTTKGAGSVAFTNGLSLSGSMTLEAGSSVTLAGNSILNKTITNNGSLEFGGNVDITSLNPTSFTEEFIDKDTENGFKTISAVYTIASGTGSATTTSGLTWQIGSDIVQGTLSGAGVLTLAGVQGTEYFITKGDVDVVGTGGTGTETGASTYTIRGGTMNLTSGTVKSSAINYSSGAIKLASGGTMEADQANISTLLQNTSGTGTIDVSTSTLIEGASPTRTYGFAGTIKVSGSDTKLSLISSEGSGENSLKGLSLSKATIEMQGGKLYYFGGDSTLGNVTVKGDSTLDIFASWKGSANQKALTINSMSVDSGKTMSIMGTHESTVSVGELTLNGTMLLNANTNDSKGTNAYFTINKLSGNGMLQVQKGNYILSEGSHAIAKLDVSKANASAGKLLLKEKAALQVNTAIWGGNNSSILLEKGASLTKGVINIAGVDSTADKQGKLQFTGTWVQNGGKDEYGIGSEDFTISNADVTIVSDTDQTIGNVLNKSSLINDGGTVQTSTAKVTATNSANQFVDIKAITGSIELMNLTNGAALKDLQIGGDKQVGAYTGADSGAAKAAVSVSGQATFGAGAVLSANLTLESGSELVSVGGANGISLNSGTLTLTLGGNIDLGDDLRGRIDALTPGGTLVLFSDVNGLTLNPAPEAVALLSARSTDTTTETDASAVFGELAPGEYIINLAQNQVLITALPIPEPTTATLSLLALAGLAARRRRR